MRNSSPALFVGLLVVLSASPVDAQIARLPACKALDDDGRRLAGEIMEEQHPYACCDDTIAACLKKEPTCSLAVRLAENICRRVAAEEPKQRIARALIGRARTMLPGTKQSKIDLRGAPMVGEPDAPVTLVEYACARCPYCSKITPKLYRAVAEGPLKGKVKLYFKTFPIRGHEFSKESGLAFVAAAELGKFWEFLLYSYEHFDGFCPRKLPDWASAAGMDREAFDKTVADPSTRQALVESKKEGIVNGVDATPTFFINGRKYYGETNDVELIDVLEEEYDRRRGKEYR